MTTAAEHRLAREHRLTLFVAAGLLALAFADGGYGVEVRASATVLAWVAIAVGVLLGALPRDFVPRTARFAGCVLAGLVLLSSLSMAWATDDGRAFAEAVRVAGYLGLFALVVLVSKRASARFWLGGIAVGIFLIAIISVSSRLLLDLPGGDEELMSFLPGSGGRLSYPIGYWNALAAVFAMGVVLFVRLSATARKLELRSVAVGAIPILGLGMYMTSSRGGIVAAAAGIVTLIALGPRRAQMLAGLALGSVGAGIAILVASGEDELIEGASSEAAANGGIKLLVATLVAVAVAVALRAVLDGRLMQVRVSARVARVSAIAVVMAALAAIVISDPGERVDEFKNVPPELGSTETDFTATHLASGSGSGRYQFWGEALDAYGSEPVLGIGAGGYESYWSEHATLSRPIRSAHSLFLEVLAELGPLGFMLVLAFLAMGPIVAYMHRNARTASEVGGCLALLATGVMSAAIEWTWDIPVAFAPVIVTVAVLTGSAALPPLTDAEKAANAGGEEPYRRFGWGLAVITVAWVCAVAAANLFATERSLSESRSSARSDHLDKAADQARDAIALQPWAAEPRIQLALVEESAGQLHDARDSISEAAERAPSDWRIWLARARIETRAGDLEQGRRALREAQRLNPRFPLFIEGVTQP